MTEESLSNNFINGVQSLDYYLKKGKVTQAEYTAVQQVMKNMYNVVTSSVKNTNRINQISSVLKNQLNAAKYELGEATSRHSEASQAAEKLSRLLKTAEVAFQSQKTSYDNLVFESEELQKEIQNKNIKNKEEMRDAEEAMRPRRERYLADINETKAMNEKTVSMIENLQVVLESNMAKINALKRKNQQADSEEKKLIELKLKIIDSPEHYFKSADNLNIEIIGMEAELKETLDEIERKDKICKVNDEKRLNQVRQQQQIEKQKLEEVSLCEVVETDIEKLKNLNYGLEYERSNDKIEMMNLEQTHDQLNRNLKSQQERTNKLRKEIERFKKEYKKEDVQKKQHEDQILEYQMMIQKLRKQQEDIHSEMRSHDGKEKDLQNELIIIENKTDLVKKKVEDSGEEQKGIQDEIAKAQAQLNVLKKNVALTQKEVKDLTAIRQSMARKASSAMSEVRETREELKVKELLIKDLSKKHEQTENKLEHFKALYEEVKSARNKYVNLIQNSSQDLAEFKERIKMLQSELEILKNESAEKNRTILEYNRQFQLEKHKRDQTKAKLNKYEFENKEKQALVDQNIKEIEKLNTIMQSLQKDMEELRSSYEVVCENRNYTGIQLIDRNDELCILYEKSNMQEIILRKEELAVKSLEDEIRMISIEVGETERKIKVARDKILVVPKLAQKVLEIQELIKRQNLRERELSSELENPNNKDRWRDLGGEDPDEQALDAKISVLEERLNSKKEQLLEKQLVLDQVTNLTDKLKHEAFDNRQSTLEVSEKLNEFQSRLKDLTRKMKATISELSMCQANAIKYQQQREGLQQLVENAKKRMEEGLPPTPETEIEYLKMMRDKKRYQEQKEIRERNDLIERSYPPFATKTTAEHRVNAYIPDEIGLPKPYGRLAPFKPNDKSNNLRHFKKPVNKEIEI